MARILSLFTFLCWVLLKDLINSKHLSIALLDLLQLPQKIPELGLGVNLVCGPELLAVNLRMLIEFNGQSTPNNFVLWNLKVTISDNKLRSLKPLSLSLSGCV